MLDKWRRVTVKRSSQVLWRHVRVAQSFLQKASGLMFARRVEPILFDFGVSDTSRNAIHSLFCVPFDAVFLDENRRIVYCRTVPPWKFFVYSPRPARFLIELPVGEARKHSLSVGERLEWTTEKP